MSIYSGFATRTQEQTYDQLLFDLLQVFSRKILKTYQQQPTDQPKFAQILKDIFLKLSLMEKQKYLQPNLSNALYDIIQYFILKEKQQAPQIQTKTPKFWVKKQKASEQNFTNDTQKQPQLKPQSRLASSRAHSRLKTPLINPEVAQTERVREKHQQYEIQIKNKFNKPRDSAQKNNKRNKKHQSLRRIEPNQFSETIYKQETQQKKFKCPHCHQQKTSRRSPKPILRRNQRSQSLQRKQKEHSRIVIPELIKEYIDSTNHMYMRHFRKRKVRNGLEVY